jgi:hypothetical protein
VNETIRILANQHAQYKTRSQKTYENRNMKVELIETESERVNILQTQNAFMFCVQVAHSREFVFQYQNKKGVGVHAINYVQRAYQ